MTKPGKQTNKQDSHEPGEETSPPKEKDPVMKSASSDTNFSLSCWWSRGPSGQVQEWESRPTAPEDTPRANIERRNDSTRWVRTSRNKKRSKT